MEARRAVSPTGAKRYDHPYLGVNALAIPEILTVNDRPDLAALSPRGRPQWSRGGGPTGRDRNGERHTDRRGPSIVAITDSGIGTPSQPSSVLAIELRQATIRRDGEERSIELPVGTRPQ